MKKLIIALALVSLTGCVAPGYNARNDTGTYQTFTGTYHGVRVVPGNGAGYFKDTASGRELSKAEKDYINVNRIDFQATQKANEAANIEITKKEWAEVQASTPKLSCEDIVALVYDVAQSKAWQTGDWSFVRNFDHRTHIRNCEAARK